MPDWQSWHLLKPLWATWLAIRYPNISIMSSLKEFPSLATLQQDDLWVEFLLQLRQSLLIYTALEWKWPCRFFVIWENQTTSIYLLNCRNLWLLTGFWKGTLSPCLFANIPEHCFRDSVQMQTPAWQPHKGPRTPSSPVKQVTLSSLRVCWLMAPGLPSDGISPGHLPIGRMLPITWVRATYEATSVNRLKFVRHPEYRTW